MLERLSRKSFQSTDIQVTWPCRTRFAFVLQRRVSNSIPKSTLHYSYHVHQHRSLADGGEIETI